jgi:hypothetical protein
MTGAILVALSDLLKIAERDIRAEQDPAKKLERIARRAQAIGEAKKLIQGAKR